MYVCNYYVQETSNTTYYYETVNCGWVVFVWPVERANEKDCYQCICLVELDYGRNDDYSSSAPFFQIVYSLFYQPHFNL